MNSKRKDIIIKSGKPFRFVQLTDLHLSLRYGQKFRAQGERLVRDVLSDEQPDFVAITGDLIWCPESAKIFRDFCELMDENGIPWGFAFGNHDRDYVYKARELEEVLIASETCLYEHGEPWVCGDGNYFLRVLDEKETLRHVLYFFDTCCNHRYSGLRGKSVGGGPSQVEWFMKKSKEVNGCGLASSFAFMHMALPEFALMWEKCHCSGSKMASLGIPELNSGLFCAFLQEGSVRAVFAGHDHGTDFSGTYEGIGLYYGKTTGFNQDARDGLGKVSPSGARVVEVGPSGAISTWFYMEDGVRTDVNGNQIMISGQ